MAVTLSRHFAREIFWSHPLPDQKHISKGGNAYSSSCEQALVGRKARIDEVDISASISREEETATCAEGLIVLSDGRVRKALRLERIRGTREL